MKFVKSKFQHAVILEQSQKPTACHDFKTVAKAKHVNGGNKATETIDDSISQVNSRDVI